MTKMVDVLFGYKYASQGFNLQSLQDIMHNFSRTISPDRVAKALLGKAGRGGVVLSPLRGRVQHVSGCPERRCSCRTPLLALLQRYTAAEQWKHRCSLGLLLTGKQLLVQLLLHQRSHCLQNYEDQLRTLQCN